MVKFLEFFSAVLCSSISAAGLWNASVFARFIYPAEVKALDAQLDPSSFFGRANNGRFAFESP